MLVLAFFMYARGLGMGSFREIDPTQFARYFLDVPYADEDPRQVMDVWLPNEGGGAVSAYRVRARRRMGFGQQARKHHAGSIQIPFAGICRCLR